ncbi:MAG TPA: hypothetical protein VFZ41_10190 [Solirubrobacterales bacterium]
MSLRRIVLAAVVLALVAPAPAAADFHLVSIREVFPGESGYADAEYVELQAYASGQHVVGGHFVTFHNAGGAKIGTETFGSNVADGRNQMTVLMATAAAESRFGVGADEDMAPGLLDPAGGAVCWESLDCVSWGSFSGPLPSPAGTPAASGGIPDGMALRRTIAPGCATLLEASDDRNNSALDFEAVFPGPRPNSVTPSERSCASGGGAGAGPGGGGSQKGQGGSGSGRPQTRIVRKPRKVTRDRTPTFAFRANRRRATFLCKIDRRRFRRCRSPLTLRRLRFGRHVFRVKARAAGRVDRTPASYRFRVVKRR